MEIEMAILSIASAIKKSQVQLIISSGRKAKDICSSSSALRIHEL